MIIIIQHEQSSSQHYQFDQKTPMIEINVSDRHANDYTAMKRLGADVNRIDTVGVGLVHADLKILEWLFAALLLDGSG